MFITALRRVLDILRSYPPSSKVIRYYPYEYEDGDEVQYFISLSKPGDILCSITFYKNGLVSFALPPEDCEGFIQINNLPESIDHLVRNTEKYIHGRLPEKTYSTDRQKISWDDPVSEVFDKLPNGAKYGPLKEYLLPFEGALLRDVYSDIVEKMIDNAKARIALEWFKNDIKKHME